MALTKNPKLKDSSLSYCTIAPIPYFFLKSAKPNSHLFSVPILPMQWVWVSTKICVVLINLMYEDLLQLPKLSPLVLSKCFCNVMRVLDGRITFNFPRCFTAFDFLHFLTIRKETIKCRKHFVGWRFFFPKQKCVPFGSFKKINLVNL